MIARGVDPLHPDSSRWYRLTWPQKPLGDGVTIQLVTWTLPSGLKSDATDTSGLTVGIRLSLDGGEVNQFYDVVCKIDTSNNQVLHETLRLYVSAEGH